MFCAFLSFPVHFALPQEGSLVALQSQSRFRLAYAPFSCTLVNLPQYLAIIFIFVRSQFHGLLPAYPRAVFHYHFCVSVFGTVYTLHYFLKLFLARVLYFSYLDSVNYWPHRYTSTHFPDRESKMERKGGGKEGNVRKIQHALRVTLNSCKGKIVCDYEEKIFQPNMRFFQIKRLFKRKMRLLILSVLSVLTFSWWQINVVILQSLLVNYIMSISSVISRSKLL